MVNRLKERPCLLQEEGAPGFGHRGVKYGGCSVQVDANLEGRRKQKKVILFLPILILSLISPLFLPLNLFSSSLSLHSLATKVYIDMGGG